TSAHVIIGLGGNIVLNDVISTATISGFKPVLNVGFLPARGQLGVHLKKAAIKNGQIISAEGYLKVGDLTWTLTQPGVELGAYRADISTDKDGITALLKN